MNVRLYRHFSRECNTSCKCVRIKNKSEKKNKSLGSSSRVTVAVQSGHARQNLH